jgi:hypothetical protein
MQGVFRPRPILAIACFSASIFALEILLTRIFSVILFHHFAFVAVSVGMLGLAAAGVRVSIASDRFTKESANADIAVAGMTFAICTLVAVALLSQIGLSQSFRGLRAVAILLIYATCVVPFYFGGLAITLLLTHHRDRFASLYACDLLAAGLSGVLVIPLLKGVGGPGAVVIVAGLAAIGAGVSMPHPVAKIRARGWMIAGLCGVVLIADLGFGALRVRRPKENEEGPILLEKWNAISRVAVFDSPMKPWALGPKYDGPVPPGLVMNIDASAATPILRGGNDVVGRYLRYELTGAAYAVANTGAESRALVIGAGGGRDVLTALTFGVHAVDAVEINPIIVEDVMRRQFATDSGRVYGDPRVEVHVGDGRTYARQSKRQYDVVQLSLVDTWAATAAGAFALSENNLYTEEAIREYLEHLTPNGVLTLTRWTGPEAIRLAIMMFSAARKIGISDPAKHLVVLQAPYTETPSIFAANIIFRRSAFDGATMSRLEAHAKETGFTWLYHPFSDPASPADRVFAPESRRLTEIVRAADPLAEARQTERYELAPSTDDWPFFFYRPRDSFFGGILESPKRLYSEGQYLLGEILAVATLTSFLVLLLPLWRRGRDALRADPGSSIMGGLYFVCIGLGFMLVEVAMIQRFVLYLGHPTYTLTSVMVGLLAGAGIGSALSGRTIARRKDPEAASFAPAIAGIVAAAVVLFSGLLQARIFAATQEQSFAAKAVIVEVLVVPVGMALGALMPLGIAGLARTPRLVPWAWSVNGFASVVGSCLAVVLSMRVGFSTTFELGALCYVTAGAAALGLRRSFLRQPSLAEATTEQNA